MSNNNRLICAIDEDSFEGAYNLANALKGAVGAIKLGLEFFASQGIKGVEKISALGLPIFLDLKLHDIPNTVYKTLKVLNKLNCLMITIHLSGGGAMVQKALEALQGSNTLLVGVTILTSLSEKDLHIMGVGNNLENYLLSLAKLGVSQGLRGMVCSGEDLLFLRKYYPPPFKLIVPGIRDYKSPVGEHKRSLDARTAILRGADYIVVGRPITQSINPRLAAENILHSIEDSE